MSRQPPKPIRLYTNKSCPWAQRARIALLEADVNFQEIEIDLVNKPEFYWTINPVRRIATQLNRSKGKFPPWRSATIF
jgi:Glutathione S-transferase, N-terminal domain